MAVAISIITPITATMRSHAEITKSMVSRVWGSKNGCQRFQASINGRYIVIAKKVNFVAITRSRLLLNRIKMDQKKNFVFVMIQQ